MTSDLLEAFKKQAIRMGKRDEIIIVIIPHSVFNNGQDVIVDYEDLLDWCFQKDAGASHITIFMRYVPTFIF